MPSTASTRRLRAAGADLHAQAVLQSQDGAFLVAPLVHHHKPGQLTPLSLDRAALPPRVSSEKVTRMHDDLVAVVGATAWADMRGVGEAPVRGLTGGVVAGR